MYSLVLMTAMTAAPETAEFHGFFRNLLSFGGCRGSCVGSCYGNCDGRGGGCTGSCYGSSCLGGRLRAFGGSCYGSCTGVSQRGSCLGDARRGFACFGSGASCYGSAMPPFDSYASGAMSFTIPGMSGLSCVGSSPMSSLSSCFGSPLGAPTPLGNDFGFPSIPGPPSTGEPPAQPMPATPPASIPDSSTGRRMALQTSANRATVIVRLPADAVLYAEGQRMSLVSGERSFVTPPLPSGQALQYNFRAEYVRDGETISRTRRVPVKAGETITVEFLEGLTTRTTSQPTAPAEPTRALKPESTLISTDQKPESNPTVPLIRPASVQVPTPTPAAPTIGDRARITVKLPPDTTLYVDGKRNTMTELIREFRTPPLQSGRAYAYTMRAERIQNGQPEFQEMKVTFMAGEITTVDFTMWPERGTK